MSRFGYFARETLISLRRNIMMTISGIITIAVTASMIGVMLLFIRGNDRAAAFQKANVELEIFMNVKAPASDVTGVRNHLDQLKRTGVVHEFTFLDHNAALKEYKRLYPKLADPDLRPSDLPESFRVTPRTAKLVDKVAADFDGMLGVSQVNTGSRVIRPYFDKVDRARNYVVIVSLALTIASVFLIVMTVRLATYARRREIEVMKLVGASNLFVRVPFLAEGAVQGMVGGVIACVVTVIGKNVLSDFAGSQRELNFLVLKGFELTNGDVRTAWVYVLVGGTLVGLASAAFGVRRFLDV